VKGDGSIYNKKGRKIGNLVKRGVKHKKKIIFPAAIGAECKRGRKRHGTEQIVKRKEGQRRPRPNRVKQTGR